MSAAFKHRAIGAVSRGTGPRRRCRLDGGARRGLKVEAAFRGPPASPSVAWPIVRDTARGRMPRARESGVKAGRRRGRARCGSIVHAARWPRAARNRAAGPFFLEKGFIRSPWKSGACLRFSPPMPAPRAQLNCARCSGMRRCDALIYLALRGAGHPGKSRADLLLAEVRARRLADLECAGAVVSSARREREYRLAPVARRSGDITEQFNWVNWPLLLCAAEGPWAVLGGDGVSGLDREDAESLRPLLERLLRARWARPQRLSYPPASRAKSASSITCFSG